MRIRVDIDLKVLKAVMSITGQRKKSSAVAHALREFIRQAKLKHFADLIRRGSFDFPLTNEEIEAQDR